MGFANEKSVKFNFVTGNYSFLLSDADIIEDLLVPRRGEVEDWSTQLIWDQEDYMIAQNREVLQNQSVKRGEPPNSM